MLTILTMIMLAQAPAQSAPRAQVQKPTARRQADLRDLLARKRAAIAKKAAQSAAADRSHERWKAEQAVAAKEQQAQYERMLPFMLEQQRQALERQSDIERNDALQRMAKAAETDAQTYQWSVWRSK